MSWTLLLGLVAILGAALVVLLRRRELGNMRAAVDVREENTRAGSEGAQLQHPVVDLSRCLGCATCVAACPEQDVLGLIHGQAMVINGAHCRGIAACERECPVGAISVTLSNANERDDIPALESDLEAVGSPGLFLAGEVTAHALIKTAIGHGAAVGAAVAERVRSASAEAPRAQDANLLDLCIVGAGPAGLACALEAKRNGLNFLTIDQESSFGGTVSKYPRRKLVLTQPVDLPIYGRLGASSYTKEELMDLWLRIASEQQLPIQGGQVFEGLERDEQGNYLVRTASGSYAARNVCLAVGRRGVPRQLGIPGEDLPKVAFSLLDANSYQGRHVLVVGGGDSAVEAALALAEQSGNQVTLSYRKEAFFRVRPRNRERIDAAVAASRLRVIYRSQLLAIHPDSVELATSGDSGSEALSLRNDEVFIMLGGIPPIELLRRSGVSFDAALRQPTAVIREQGSGLLPALGTGFALALMALAWALYHRDYYGAPSAERAANLKHDFLRPSQGLGLWFGIASVVLVCVNLLYLLRRSPRARLQWGSLQAWMTSHVATGILALLCAMLHGAMAPRDTTGGHAYWALSLLLVTGAIGRYFYAWFPRAANGRELALDEVKAKLGWMSEEWDQGQQKFRATVRTQVLGLIDVGQWRSSFLGRIKDLVGGHRKRNQILTQIARQGRADDVPEHLIKQTLAMARDAHRSATVAAHYEDLRAVLNSWRYLHRWVAVLMVLLVIAHVAYAMIYGESSGSVIGGAR
ncbi:MAG: thioredoxin reductase/Pyruvate/2-oxoacid:ferredoxin oxidoreductase delta subunit [Planctomycetota bacterium]